MAKNWIAGALKNAKKGSLHRALKVKKGAKIPLTKLKSAAKKSGITGKRARLAMTLRGFRKKKK